MYVLKVIQRWWGHSAGLMCALTINWFIFVTVAEQPSWIASFWSSFEGGLTPGLFLLVAGLGPLINLFAWAVFCYFMDEAIDDIRFHEQETGTPRQRSLLVLGNSGVWGAFLLPIFLWPYTFHIESLWGKDHQFWFMPGYFWFSLLGATIAIYAVRNNRNGASSLKDYLSKLGADLFRRK